VNKMQAQNEHLQVLTGSEAQSGLWGIRLKSTGRTTMIAAPSFEVDGLSVDFSSVSLQFAGSGVKQANGVTEHLYEGVHPNGLRLELILRIADDFHVLRFKYRLSSCGTARLTKAEGADRLTYLSVSFAGMSNMKEVRLSDFNEMVHSFVLAEHEVNTSAFDNRLRLMGPMLIGGEDGCSLLVAYEHGSQVPDMFLGFRLEADRRVKLEAVKGNYYDGQTIDESRPYHTIWMQFAWVEGDEEALAKEYRTFVLHGMSANTESRKPYIYYNSWAFQERNKYGNGKSYLDSMNEERIMAEIEVAHTMGIEVFVIDTGWYVKTGDWEVDRSRFRDGLWSVKRKLDGYGMKLGLWFDPLAAAVSSRIMERNEPFIMSWEGNKLQPVEIWETEKSHKMCLVSPYSDAFTNELIRLVKDIGVTYFKWDAIGQYGCSDPGHDHGMKSNETKERADCYAFSIGRVMSDIVDKLCSVCPEAIVDFDITEGHRYVGLGFLSSGKYFLINNGPYYWNYNIPCPEDRWSNIFVYPGPARTWVCRTPLTFDKWIPSVLFLTHYLPDDPAESQIVNIASLILGQNGIWGDLLSVSGQGIELIGSLLTRYKEVREDITEAYPVRVGAVGGSLEVHEKINTASGYGALVVFSNAAGRYSYVTANSPSQSYWAHEGATLTYDISGRAVVELDFESPGAKIIFFNTGS
jgi:alpha-galactosidase